MKKREDSVHKKKLERMNPDIVTKINEHMRLKKEEMRRRRHVWTRPLTRSEIEIKVKKEM